MGGADMHCEHCSLTLTGMEQYTQHLAGKKHLKKLKAKGLSPSAQGPFASPSGNVSGESNSGYSVAAPFISPGQKRSRLAGGQFGPSSPPSDPIAQGPLHAGGSDPVMAAIKANMMGKLPTKKQQYSGRCDLCNVDYTSESHEDQHLKGQKHKKKVTLSEGGTNVATFYCSFCNVTVNSVQQMDSHRLGTVHKKKVEKRKAEQGAAAGDVSPAKKQFVPSSDTATGSGNNYQAIPGPPPPHLYPK